MKRYLLLPLFILSIGRTPAQYRPAAAEEDVTRMFRVYEDNDGINAFGHSTDDAYTNGTRLDLFYRPARRPHGLLGRWAPQAGDSSIDIYGWGLMQLMYTPKDISQTDYQPDDYPYSGAIIATHTRYSYNPIKHYDWQTELVMGAIGPVSLAHQTQSIVHHLTGFMQPMGWGTQFHNALLFNVNVTGEKQLAAAGNALRIIGGGQIFAGMMQNGAAVYPLILLGRTNGYFHGTFSQYTGYDREGHKSWQVYFLAKPELAWFLTNALLEGGLFTTNPNIPAAAGNKPLLAGQQASATRSAQQTPPPPPPPAAPALQPWVASLSFGTVLSHGNFGLSFLQNISSPTLKRLYSHEVGNVSLYFAW
jgi:hypothetical protein